MMNCEDAFTFVDAWEKDGGGLENFEDFKAHLGVCPRCAKRFDALLDLIERDASPAAAGEASPGAAVQPRPLPESFVGSVMSKLSERKASFFHLNPIMAAAAAAIFAAGIGLGIWFGSRSSDMATVKFALYAPQASSVQLAGDFNAWNSKGFELTRSGSQGTWTISIPLKKDKVYVYNFVIDGKTWIPDPRVPAKVDDGFGGASSLLRL